MKRKIKRRNTGKFVRRCGMDRRKFMEIFLNMKKYSEFTFIDLTYSVLTWYCTYHQYASCVRRSRRHDSTYRVQENLHSITYMSNALFENSLHRPVRSDMLLPREELLITVRNN